jgi:hypothetical protein
MMDLAVVVFALEVFVVAERLPVYVSAWSEVIVDDFRRQGRGGRWRRLMTGACWRAGCTLVDGSLPGRVVMESVASGRCRASRIVITELALQGGDLLALAVDLGGRDA